MSGPFDFLNDDAPQTPPAAPKQPPTKPTSPPNPVPSTANAPPKPPAAPQPPAGAAPTAPQLRPAAPAAQQPRPATPNAMQAAPRPAARPAVQGPGQPAAATPRPAAPPTPAQQAPTAAQQRPQAAPAQPQQRSPAAQRPSAQQPPRPATTPSPTQPNRAAQGAPVTQPNSAAPQRRPTPPAGQPSAPAARPAAPVARRVAPPAARPAPPPARPAPAPVVPLAEALPPLAQDADPLDFLSSAPPPADFAAQAFAPQPAQQQPPHTLPMAVAAPARNHPCGGSSSACAVALYLLVIGGGTWGILTYALSVNPLPPSAHSLTPEERQARMAEFAAKNKRDREEAEQQKQAVREQTRARQERQAAAVEKLKPSIVKITIKNARGKETGLGTGFVIDPKGLIATNYHVIDTADAAEAMFQDGTKRRVLGVRAWDPDRDLAIVEIEPGDKPLTPVPMRSELPRMSSPVLALGHPQGLSYTTADGIVSGLPTSRDLPNQYGVKYDSPADQTWIQSTTLMTGGNSGGPLIDDEGRVIGINTWIAQRRQDGLLVGDQAFARPEKSAASRGDPVRLGDRSGREIGRDRSDLRLAHAMVRPTFARTRGRRKNCKRPSTSITPRASSSRRRCNSSASIRTRRRTGPG
ncbi:MAG: trypsin-like peptidase domain-containing protein [Pirellulales bacterium]